MNLTRPQSSLARKTKEGTCTRKGQGIMGRGREERRLGNRDSKMAAVLMAAEVENVENRPVEISRQSEQNR